MSGPAETLEVDPLFELGEALREQLELTGADATLQFGELAARFGLDEQDVRDCLEGILALDLALGEDLPAAPPDEGPPALPPPELPADFELIGELGQGGMGVVYRARQRSLGRTVAVKVLRPGELQFGELLRRFEREARTLARLSHPHVVPIHEVGRAGEHVFFSMALIEGCSLAELLSRERLNPARAVAILEQVAGAVAYVHAEGVIHRDLKPANVLLDEEGRAYVVDFGLAVELGNDGLTATGHVLGTPAYMSPEQARGARREVGEASDVYALGAILYECLTGRAPFRRRSLAETLQAVLSEEPAALRSLEPTVPPELEAVALKALAKDPAERYPSAAALREDLRRFAAGEPVLARPPSRVARLRSWARRRPGRALLAAQGTLVALGLLGWGGVRGVEWALERARQRALAEERFADSAQAWREQVHARLLERAAAGEGLAKTQLAWDRALGFALPQDEGQALAELAEAAAAGEVSAVPAYLGLLEQGWTAIPYESRSRGAAGLESDLRGLSERDPDLWERERARIERAAAAGEGWARWVRAELGRSSLRDDVQERLVGTLAVDDARAATDLVAVVSAPEFGWTWRQLDERGELFLADLFVQGPTSYLRNQAVTRSPAGLLARHLAAHPELIESTRLALCEAARAGNPGAAATLLVCGAEGPPGFLTPELCQASVEWAYAAGLARIPWRGLDPVLSPAVLAGVRVSAEQGSWEAMLELADCYRAGIRGLRDDHEAERLWARRARPLVEAAAERGEPRALRTLARWSLYGDAVAGVEASEVRARALLEQAERAEAQARAHPARR